MSVKERIRLEALARVSRKELTVLEAAELMGLSLRQARRIYKRFKAQGDGGLVHRLRGRRSNRRLSDDLRDRVVKLHQEKYADFGPTFACEKLVEAGLVLSPDTLTTILKDRGLWQRKRRRGRHRKRRQRRAGFGSLVQLDGSHHDWFEGHCSKCVLMVMIDDATNKTYARLYPAETTGAAFDVVDRWIKRHGLPRSLYVDRHSIYRDEDHPQKPTQFGRAMKALGVELIAAYSPQAKGRVERRHAVFQDRFVKELRLRHICSMDQANDFLEGVFLEDLNRRYAIRPRHKADLHRAVKAKESLNEVLCVQEQRVVGRDWCVRWQNRFLQIDAQHESLNLAGRRVLIKHLADGRLLVEREGERLTAWEIKARPPATKLRVPVVNNRKWKPGPKHPWRVESECPVRPPAIPAAGTNTRKAG